MGVENRSIAELVQIIFLILVYRPVITKRISIDILLVISYRLGGIRGRGGGAGGAITWIFRGKGGSSSRQQSIK